MAEVYCDVSRRADLTQAEPNNPALGWDGTGAWVTRVRRGDDRL